MADKACHVVGSTTQVGLTQALGRMRKIIATASLVILAAAVVFVSSCSIQANRRTDQLAKVVVGDAEASVLARLGQPRVREITGQPYLLYATNACTAPCVTRLWWEWPLFRGIEAWSVELDNSNRVVSTAHWVSP